MSSADESDRSCLTLRRGTGGEGGGKRGSAGGAGRILVIAPQLAAASRAPAAAGSGRGTRRLARPALGPARALVNHGCCFCKPGAAAGERKRGAGEVCCWWLHCCLRCSPRTRCPLFFFFLARKLAAGGTCPRVRSLQSGLCSPKTSAHLFGLLQHRAGAGSLRERGALPNVCHFL